MKKLMTLLFVTFLSFSAMNVQAEKLYLDLSDNGAWVEEGNPAEYQAWVYGGDKSAWTAVFTPVPGEADIYETTVPNGSTVCVLYRRVAGTPVSLGSDYFPEGDYLNKTGSLYLNGIYNCVKIYSFNWNNGELSFRNLTGISTSDFDQQPVKAQYFTVSGQEVTNPSTGLYLVKKTFADNSVKTEKVLVK